jgi:signal transduction histidine kinase
MMGPLSRDATAAMKPEELYRRYQELQAYTGWTAQDAQLVRNTAGLVQPHFPELVDDFYAEILRHPDAHKVITGGSAQIERLKGTLIQWLVELLSGQYDAAYVERRWRVGWRHVEIGLDQVYTNVALSRLRTGLTRLLHENWSGDQAQLRLTVRALNKLLVLDLAIIEDAYQAEYMARQQRTERLATIGQVAGGVAHELRNPLNVVKTSVYYLLHARNPVPEKVVEHLERIERHVTLADGVITTLANFARTTAPALKPFSLARCVRDTLEINKLPANIHVDVRCGESLPAALADEDQVRIALGNIIRNARDAMPEGGTLTIEGRPSADGLEIAVTDTGVGIAPENMSRITEPLFSTKARGLGLGLSIARAVLDKNKGSLKVVSEPGKGSTFTIRLQREKAS